MERLVLYKGKKPIKPTNGFNLSGVKVRSKFSRKVPRMSADEYIALYAGNKRKIYEKAKRSLAHEPINVKDSWIKGFVKKDKFDLSQKPDQVPRLIQPRTPRYNLELGRFVKPMEKVIYEEINEMYGHTVVMKGLNAEERGKILKSHWDDIPDPVCVMLDQARFDQHTRKQAIRYEHKSYMNHVETKDKAKLHRLLQWQLETRGTIYTKEGKIKYRMKDGVRCSGDTTTSLGNMILMADMMYEYIIKKKIQYRFFLDGDDGGLIVSRKDLHLIFDLVDWFATLGYVTILEEAVDTFEQINFCQSNPVWNGERYIMCRNPDKIMNGDCYTTKSVTSKKQWDYYRASIGNCGIAAMGELPIVGAYYDALRRGAGAPKATLDEQSGLYWMSRGMNRERRQPGDETRVSFFKAFGYTPDQQILLEDKYDRLVHEYLPSGVHQYLYQ